MSSINEDEMFEPILFNIQNGSIKTTHHLRLALEMVSEKSNLKTLLILEMFRAWLAKRNIELITEHGMVTITQLSL